MPNAAKTAPAPKGRLTGRAPAGASTGIAGIPTWSYFAEQAGEDVPELRWPASIDTNERMGRSSQVASLLRLFKSPIVNYKLTIHPGNVDPASLASVSRCLGIPIEGQSEGASDRAVRRSRARRSRLIRETLRALTIGHAVLEIEGKETPGGGWDLAGLHYLSPRSLSRWQFRPGTTDVDYIEQLATVGTGGPLKLPASRLAILRWALDPDMPYGESLLRPIFENWLSKDNLMKIDLVAGSRNGIGYPWIEMAKAAEAGHAVDYEALVTGLAAGEDTGVALPNGSKLRIEGVSGNTFDAVSRFHYHDGQAAKVLAGSIIELGQTKVGSRDLSGSHDDLLWEARDGSVEWMCNALDEQVLAPVAIWKGADPEDEDGLPWISWDRPQTPEPLTANDWATLKDAGLIDDSEETRAEFSRRYQLPAQGKTSEAEPEAKIAASARRIAAATDTDLVPGVPQATRDLTEFEDASKWPFARVQTAWAAARDTLVDLWRRVRTDMIGRATSVIAELEDLEERLDELHDLTRAAAVGAITDKVLAQAAAVTTGLADQSVHHVVEAAAAQGVTVSAVDPGYDDHALRDARLVGQSLASTVSDQVARRAGFVASAGVTSETVAKTIAADLADLTDANLNVLAGSQATAAQSHGQAAQSDDLEAKGLVRSIYYSSLLDGRTCTACAARDGHKYPDMAAVREDFPVGGYWRCEGGPQCRCTWVLVMSDETPATVGLGGDA